MRRILRYVLLVLGFLSGALAAAEDWGGWTPTWSEVVAQSLPAGALAFGLACVLHVAGWRGTSLDVEALGNDMFRSPLHFAYSGGQVLGLCGLGAMVRGLIASDLPMTIGTFVLIFGTALFLLVVGVAYFQRRAHSTQ